MINANPWAASPARRISRAALRLSRIARLSQDDLRALACAEADAKPFRARGELIAEGQPISETRLIVSGWAARVRLLPDGRRQFLNFLLPGDLIGRCAQSRPLASSTVIAITDVSVASAPPSDESRTLTEAYAVSGALEEAYLLAQIVRLGRLNAEERIADLMLELHERLGCAGLATHDSFDLPLTQEMLADALGLTSVHINRMLQLMRREGELIWKHGRLTLPDVAALTLRTGRVGPRVTAEPHQSDGDQVVRL